MTDYTADTDSIEAVEMARKRKRSGNPSDLHTIEDFCERNRISEAMYFKLKRLGKAPREMKLGKKILITPEAETDWRREREAE
jgi:hypothetical protein